MSDLLLAWLVTMLASGVIDLLTNPKPASWRKRTFRAMALHIAAVTGLCIVFLAIWNRTWFSVLCTVGILGLLVTVSNAKYQVLREPVVFSDLALFAQSFRHPRLYFPFLSWVQVITFALGVGLFAIVFWLESQASEVSTTVLMVVWLLLYCFQVVLARGLILSLNPEQDQALHGFFAVFVAYLLNGLSWREIHRVKKQFGVSPYATINIRTNRKTDLYVTAAPDVVVVQSESFMDIRRIGVNTKPGVLAHYDALRQSSICAGSLAVPAWGANTMRTEHAFLSGLPNESLRYARFYPYAYVTSQAPSLPNAFKKRGYQCMAVHPYHADFFARNKVFPRLGFDEFADYSKFLDAAYFGPYISDDAVTSWLIKTLEQSSAQPRLLFAITMENHGPLHLEPATRTEAKALYSLPDGGIMNDLTVYVRHLANADKMLGRLGAYLEACQRDTVLCFYGDHVPAMGQVYEALDTTPQNSDYFIWRNHQANFAGVAATEFQIKTPEQLGEQLAQIAHVM